MRWYISFYLFLLFFSLVLSFLLFFFVFSLGREREGKGRLHWQDHQKRHPQQTCFTVCFECLFILISFVNYRSKINPYYSLDNFLVCHFHDRKLTIIIVKLLPYCLCFLRFYFCPRFPRFFSFPCHIFAVTCSLFLQFFLPFGFCQLLLFRQFHNHFRNYKSADIIQINICVLLTYKDKNQC